MKKDTLNHILNIVMGSFCGFFIGYGLYSFIDYRARPVVHRYAAVRHRDCGCAARLSAPETDHSKEIALPMAEIANLHHTKGFFSP